MIWILIGTVVSGIVSGMGMGGGTLLIPILTILFGVSQHSAQGINLLAFIPASILSLAIHIKNKLVNYKIGIIIICVGCVVSFFSALLAIKIQAAFLKIIFGSFLIIIGLLQLVFAIKQFINSKKKQKKQPQFKVLFFTTKMFK